MPVTTWLLDLAFVGGTLIAIALSFASIGAVVQRLLGRPLRSLDDGFLAFWVGFAVVTWLLIVWNFAFPVDSTALFGVVAMAAACGAVSFGSALDAIRASRTAVRIGAVVVVAFVTVWVASRCLVSFRSWDGVLYHIQGVAWAKAYPAIPGIANLHGPLAFNNSSFLYDALVDSWIWEGRGFHVANGALLLVAMLQGASAGLRWLSRGQRDHARLFEFLLLPIGLVYTPAVATYSTDLPMALVLSAAIARTCAVLEESKNGGRSITRDTGVALALLFGTAIAIKLTAAVFSATAIAVLMWRIRTRSWVWPAVTLLIFLGPWVGRGIELSGYPFFPLPYLGFPVDWRAPLEHARAELANITFTEREFSWHIVGRDWVYLTVVRNVGAIFLPSLLAAFAVIRWWSITKEPRRAGFAEWALVLPSLVGIAAWFSTAPSHRYAPVLFWTLAAVSVSRWILASLQASRMKLTTAWLAAAAIAISPLIASSVTAWLLKQPPSSGAAGLSYLSTDFPTQPFVTNSGLVVNTPAPRAYTPELPNGCGNAPLPCTANPATNLELRVPGSLDKGFRIRGGWEMTNFPYPWRPTFLQEWRSRQKHDR